MPAHFTWEQRPEIVRVQNRPRMRGTFACTDRPLTSEDELFVPWPLDGAFVVARRHDGSVRTGYMAGDRTIGVVVEMAALISETPTTRAIVAQHLRGPDYDSRQIAAVEQ